jgi:predicted RNA-binding protein YlxR (DUF448 family)
MKADMGGAMVRIAARDGAVVADFQRRVAGRGGYLHPKDDCIERFVNAKLREFRSLRRKIDRSERLNIAAAIRSHLAREATVE